MTVADIKLDSPYQLMEVLKSIRSFLSRRGLKPWVSLGFLSLEGLGNFDL